MSVIRSISMVLGAITLTFGLNWYRSTASGLSFFHVAPPLPGSEHAATVDCMGAVIGIRNIAIGGGIIAAALFKERKTLGVLLIAFAVAAVVDGYATKMVSEEGAWDHWNYAPMVALFGIANLRSW
ncbi:hypothetical protein HJFPF1_04320 [Paramyrothecium foliicola]|nr:hypothetical protein HJFPF1_04320 [Paramyrothecium foliicola]